MPPIAKQSVGSLVSPFPIAIYLKCASILINRYRQGIQGAQAPLGPLSFHLLLSLDVDLILINTAGLMPHIAIVNGPNLNALGVRQPQHYGTQSLAQLEAALRKEAATLGMLVSFFQSNHEGAIIDHLYGLREAGVTGIILNPGALAHTSLALHDAVLAVEIPTIEVHLSQLFQRALLEPARRPLCVAPACRGVITGLGVQGYLLALRAFCHHDSP